MALAIIVHSEAQKADIEADNVFRYLNYFEIFNGKTLHPRLNWSCWDMDTNQTVWRTLIEVEDANGNELFAECEDKVFVLTQLQLGAEQREPYINKVRESMDQIIKVTGANFKSTSTVYSNEFFGKYELTVLSEADPKVVFSAIREDISKVNKDTPKH